MPSGLVQGLGGIHMAVRLGPSSRRTGTVAKKPNNILHGSSRKPPGSLLAPKAQLAEISPAHDILTSRFQSSGHSSYKACVFLQDVLLHFQQELRHSGCGSVVECLPSLCEALDPTISITYTHKGLGADTLNISAIFYNCPSSLSLRKKKMECKIMPNIWRIAVLFSHCGLCEIKKYFFLQRWKNNAFLL